MRKLRKSSKTEPAGAATTSGTAEPGARKQQESADTAFLCTVCAKGFSSLGNLKQHGETHFKQKQNPTQFCDNCGKGFTQKRYLKRHRHSCALKSFKVKPTHCCSICGKEFDRLSHLERHHAIHTGTGSTVSTCDFCGQEFTQKAHLQRHLFAKHRDAARTFHTNPRSMHKFIVYACLRCPDRAARSFPTRWELRRHESLVHAVELSCQSCQEEKKRSVTFETLASWKSHVEYHRGRRKFLCEVCWRGFAKKGVLQSHMASVHWKSPSFQCSVCEEVFTQRTQIERHIKANHHEDRREFSCKFCEDKLPREKNVRTHLRVRHRHTGRIHFCKQCPVWFTERSALTEHLKQHFTRIEPNASSMEIDIEEEEDPFIHELKLLVKISGTQRAVTALKLSKKMPLRLLELYPQLERLEIDIPEMRSGEELRVNVPLYSNSLDSHQLLDSELEIYYP